MDQGKVTEHSDSSGIERNESTSSGLRTVPPPLVATSESAVDAAMKSARKWRYYHILACCAAFILSGATFTTTGLVNNDFYPNCILSAKWKFQMPTTAPNVSACGKRQLIDFEVSQVGTTWGGESQCRFSQFGFCAVAAIVFIMGWFFLLFRSTKNEFYQRRTPTASLLVIPGLIFSFGLFVTCLIATIVLIVGVQEWCKAIYTSNDHFKLTCSTIMSYCLAKHETIPYFQLLLSSQVTAILSTLSLLAQVILLFLRFWRQEDFPPAIYPLDLPLCNSKDVIVLPAKSASASANLNGSVRKKSSGGSLTTSSDELVEGKNRAFDMRQNHAVSKQYQKLSPIDSSSEIALASACDCSSDVLAEHPSKEQRKLSYSAVVASDLHSKEDERLPFAKETRPKHQHDVTSNGSYGAIQTNEP